MILNTILQLNHNLLNGIESQKTLTRLTQKNIGGKDQNILNTNLTKTK